MRCNEEYYLKIHNVSHLVPANLPLLPFPSPRKRWGDLCPGESGSKCLPRMSPSGQGREAQLCPAPCSAAPSYPRVEEQGRVLVQQGLVLLVARTEVLQELVGQPHDLLHLGVLGLCGRGQVNTRLKSGCGTRPRPSPTLLGIAGAAHSARILSCSLPLARAEARGLSGGKPCQSGRRGKAPGVPGAPRTDLLVRDLQQLQHHGVRAHVPEQPLLLLPALAPRRALLHAQLAEPDQDLGEQRQGASVRGPAARSPRPQRCARLGFRTPEIQRSHRPQEAA